MDTPRVRRFSAKLANAAASMSPNSQRTRPFPAFIDLENDDDQEHQEHDIMAIDSPSPVRRTVSKSIFSTSPSDMEFSYTSSTSQSLTTQPFGIEQTQRRRRTILRHKHSIKEEGVCEDDDLLKAEPQKQRRKLRHLKEKNKNEKDDLEEDIFSIIERRRESSRQSSVSSDVTMGSSSNAGGDEESSAAASNPNNSKPGRRRKLRPHSTIVTPTIGAWGGLTAASKDISTSGSDKGIKQRKRRKNTEQVVMGTTKGVKADPATKEGCSSDGNDFAYNDATRRRRRRPDPLSEKLYKFNRIDSYSTLDLSQHLVLPDSQGSIQPKRKSKVAENANDTQSTVDSNNQQQEQEDSRKGNEPMVIDDNDGGNNRDNMHSEEYNDNNSNNNPRYEPCQEKGCIHILTAVVVLVVYPHIPRHLIAKHPRL